MKMGKILRKKQNSKLCFYKTYLVTINHLLMINFIS